MISLGFVLHHFLQGCVTYMYVFSHLWVCIVLQSLCISLNGIRLYSCLLQGELVADKLYAKASDKLLSIRKQLQSRTARFPEYGDYRILQTWLLAVRGIGLQDPLKMVTPPLLPAAN